MDQSFPKNRRVRSQQDFAATFQARCFAGDEKLIINGRLREGDVGSSRLGLSIGRRYGNAPQRNLWKRIIREAFRLEQENLPTGWDFIVRPRDKTLPSLAEARHSLVILAMRLTKRNRSRNS